MKRSLFYLLCCLSIVPFAACGPQEPPKIAVTGISLDRVKVSMTEGESTTLVATVLPADATDKSVTWSSSNTATATVTDGGMVNAVHAGTTVITAKTNDGGITASCSITVDIAMAAITGEASHISCRNATLSGKANLPANTATDLKIGILYATSEGVLFGSATAIEAKAFDGEFNYSIVTDVLKPETTYYYRGYILQNNEVTYGDAKSFTTLPVSSMIQTLDATGVDAGVATLNAMLDLTDCKYDAIEYGFKLTPQGDVEGSYNANNLSDAAFSYKVETLVRDKQYDVNAYVTLDGRTYTAESKSFITQSIKANISLDEVSSITEFEATISGKLNVESQGQFSKSAKLYYSDKEGSSEELKSTGTFKSITLNAQGDFSLAISDLEPGKTYYYTVIANVDGVSFPSEVRSFTTLGIVVTAKDATDITEFKAKLNGSIVLVSTESTSMEVWFLYSATTKTVEGLKTQGIQVAATLAADGTFSTQLTGLTDNNEYYYIACARVKGQEYTSDVRCFSTANIGVSVVATGATGISDYQITLNGCLTVNSIESIDKEVWFRYSTSESDVATGTKVVSTLSTSGTFSKQLTGLKDDEIYYYIACAKVNGQEYVSEIKTFTTASISVSVVATAATNITELKGTLNGSLTVRSLESVSKEVWFRYSTSESDVSTGTKVVSTLSTSGTFSKQLTGLKDNKTYYYIACAKVNGQEYTSEIKTFTTASIDVNVVATAATNITELKGTLNGSLTVRSSESVSKEVWFRYSTSESDVSTGAKVVSTLSTSGTFSKQLTGLKDNETYYYIACAKVNGTEYYSEINHFETAKIGVSLNTEAATGITEFKATMNGCLAVFSIESFSNQVGFYYSKTAKTKDDLKAEGKKVSASLNNDSTFSRCVSSLADQTTYYYVAYSVINGTEYLGSVRSFSTASIGVSLATHDATSISGFKATLNGILTTSSIESVSKSVWFIYSESASTADELRSLGKKETAYISSDGTFCKELASLIDGTTYYYMAGASVNGKEFYGEVKSFSTLSYSDLVITNEASSVIGDSATLNGALTVADARPFVQDVWFLYSETASTIENLKSSGRTKSASLSNDSFYAELSALKPSTTYHFIACVKTQDKVFYGTSIKCFTTPEAVCSVNGVEYGSLMSAAVVANTYSAANNEVIITLIKNIDNAPRFSLNNPDIPITFDLNGHTISSADSALVTVGGGVVNLIDNGLTKGKITSSASNVICMDSAGTINLKKIVIESTQASASDVYRSAVVYLNNSGGKMALSDGCKIIATGQVTGVSNRAGSLTISDSEVSSGINTEGYPALCNGNTSASTTVNSGSFYSSASKRAVVINAAGLSSSTTAGDITINGGFFYASGDAIMLRGNYTNHMAHIFVNGGYFNKTTVWTYNKQYPPTYGEGKSEKTVEPAVSHTHETNGLTLSYYYQVK